LIDREDAMVNVQYFTCDRESHLRY